MSAIQEESKDKKYDPPLRSQGPHNLGDPDDRSLRKIEKRVLIPDLMRNKARKELCKDVNYAFAMCAKEHGLLMTFKCNEFSNKLKECIKSHFEDPEFEKICTKEYLDDRSEYRRTGLNKKKRDFLKTLDPSPPST